MSKSKHLKLRILSFVSICILTINFLLMLSVHGAEGSSFLEISDITANSITVNVVYPVSGDYGNKLELQDIETGEWQEIGNGYITDGQYTFRNLVENREYMVRLTYLSRRRSVTLEEYATTTRIKTDRPVLNINDIGFNYVTVDVVYPISGNVGNKLEIKDVLTGKWSSIGDGNRVKNGQYSFKELTQGREYLVKLTYVNNNGKERTIEKPVTLKKQMANPNLTIKSTTDNTVVVDVVYPESGVFGNRLQMQDKTTGEWKEIGDINNVTNGQYTFYNLTSNKDYMVRLSYLMDGKTQNIDKNVTTDRSLATPVLTIKSVTTNTVVVQATYPESGAFGNRLQIQDKVTGEWKEIGDINNVEDGQYTFYNLVSNRNYMVRLSYLLNGRSQNIDKSITTNKSPSPLSTPSLTVKGITTSSVTVDVVYPVSGQYENRLEIQDRVTGVWSDIGQKNNIKNGQYTFKSLYGGRDYLIRLTYMSNGVNKTIEKHVTISKPSVASPSIYIKSVSSSTATFDVIFAVSGASGNRLRLYDMTTREWKDIGKSNLTNGQYTFTGLIAGRQYMARLSYVSNGKTYSLDKYITACSTCRY